MGEVWCVFRVAVDFSLQGFQRRDARVPSG